jgi:hypothetical protein
MEIRVAERGVETYNNSKIKKQVFTSQKEKFRYIINFLNDKANSKTSKDAPSHLKGSRFLAYKDGNPFNLVEFSIGGDSKDVDTLTNILY